MAAIYKTPEGEALVRGRYLELLARWPIGYERMELSTREGTTSVIACGDPAAPPLLLFHGSMSNSLMWANDCASWARHFRTYAVDLIGEPGLSAAARPDEHSDAYALWLDDVLTALGIDSPAMVGISLGGWLALDYAIRRPGRVRRLAVMCPAGVGSQRHGFFFKALFYLMLGQWGRERLRRDVLGGSARSGGGSGRLTLYMDYIAMIQRHFRARVVRFDLFSDEMLHSLEMPVLAIIGGRDVFFDAREMKRRFETQVPGARVVYHPAMGHMIVEQTDEILGFLLSNPQ